MYRFIINSFYGVKKLTAFEKLKNLKIKKLNILILKTLYIINTIAKLAKKMYIDHQNLTFFAKKLLFMFCKLYFRRYRGL
jgi:hypothetical protein